MRCFLAQLQVVLLMSTAFPSSARAEERSWGRSMVVTQYGIVATSYVQASQAGARILQQGGSAIDAGIAANAVLSVAEPMMNGMGGDLFAIYWEAKTGKLYGLNASGWAPKALTIEHLHRKGLHSVPLQGIDSVTVPGAVDGWAKLHARFGKLPWAALFDPAIETAENGFPVPEAIQAYWATAASELKDEESRRVFLPGGNAPQLGQLFRNADLANALRLVARGGEAAFYDGPIAQAILKTSRQYGGTMTRQDLTEYSAEWVDPISISYRGWKLYELPPNGDGIAALEMLQIMQQSEPASAGPVSAPELHKRIEAMKLSYADVLAYNGDPRFGSIPITELLSQEHAAKRARLIHPDKANCSVAPQGLKGSDTTYLSVVDRQGNILSLIQSNYQEFGSGITVPGAGFVLQDRGALFSLDPNSPNALTGRKRPFHTIIPGFMQKGTQSIGFGIMGGMNQPLAHAQFVSNLVDYRMNIQTALEEARFTVTPELLSCNIRIESRVPPQQLDALRRMGHVLDVRAAYSTTMGRGQAVLFDSSTGIKFGASDPRADGAAIPEAAPSR